ncbi:hypothetical protein SAMN05428949_6472 [Chitinophaga sp. YR627]|uniref:hypothetical protein n=1 Tax=Chitinophaga sp. YR627 TaxID=1881041 RepID=UPI0008E72D8F|nr:hypothetical protein [Chitinophaga sp. YR627]SFO75114.1 hypothetical protein SAMN05428949_6472 [Chitinophaga sp. YR627]
MKKFLENVGGAITLIVSAAIIWHAKIILFNSDLLKVVAPFKVTPVIGYTWGDELDDSPRYFWNNTAAKWHPGYRVPGFQMVSNEKVGSFSALPGYKFTSKDPNDFTTVWTQGQKHPIQQATSSIDEGSWNPNPGYKFLNNASGDSVTVWTPGLLHPDAKVISSYLENKWNAFPEYTFIGDESFAVSWDPEKAYMDYKVISSSTKDDYYAFPGYEFLDDQNNLHVVWKPGIRNFFDPQKIAGDVEGEWITDYDYTPPNNRASGFWKAVSFLIVGGLNHKLENAIGANPISEGVNHVAMDQFLDGLGQLITNSDDDPVYKIKPVKKHLIWKNN